MILVDRAKLINYIFLLALALSATYIALLIGKTYPEYAPYSNPQYLAILVASIVVILIVGLDSIFKLTIKDLKKKNISPKEFYEKSPMLGKRAAIREYQKYCGDKEDMIDYLSTMYK